MDLDRILRDLRRERDRLEASIFTLEGLTADPDEPKRRGRPRVRSNRTWPHCRPLSVDRINKFGALARKR